MGARWIRPATCSGAAPCARSAPPAWRGRISTDSLRSARGWDRGPSPPPARLTKAFITPVVGEHLARPGRLRDGAVRQHILEDGDEVNDRCAVVGVEVRDPQAPAVHAEEPRERDGDPRGTAVVVMGERPVAGRFGLPPDEAPRAVWRRGAAAGDINRASCMPVASSTGPGGICSASPQ